MSFQRFSLHHTFLDGLRSSLDMTMDGQWRHPQNSNITPAVHVLPRHNPDHPLAGERQEFRTNAGPILARLLFRHDQGTDAANVLFRTAACRTNPTGAEMARLKYYSLHYSRLFPLSHSDV